MDDQEPDQIQYEVYEPIGLAVNSVFFVMSIVIIGINFIMGK
ncbi:hypothetical protein PH210_09535 [Paenibacillus sp. BSR1-1]|nr:hypothetical protein [Paenibacillus sp. BSR1-1]MDN3016443.1 hypothetical protein [Paenibacillus sp. BSR1-1]